MSLLEPLQPASASCQRVERQLGRERRWQFRAQQDAPALLAARLVAWLLWAERLLVALRLPAQQLKQARWASPQQAQTSPAR